MDSPRWLPAPFREGHRCTFLGSVRPCSQIGPAAPHSTYSVGKLVESTWWDSSGPVSLRAVPPVICRCIPSDSLGARLYPHLYLRCRLLRRPLPGGECRSSDT